MKSLIVYGSRHHGNTRKVAEYLAKRQKIDLVDAEAVKDIDYEMYDLIGFASGLDFGKFYPSVTELALKLPRGKKVYALYTCAKDAQKYGLQIAEIARKCDCQWLGKYGCKGWNTYGPWKLIGGMNKNHPSAEELVAAEQFYLDVLQQAEKER